MANQVRVSLALGDSPCNEQAKGKKASGRMSILLLEVISVDFFFHSNCIHQADASSAEGLAPHPRYASDGRETRI